MGFRFFILPKDYPVALRPAHTLENSGIVKSPRSNLLIPVSSENLDIIKSSCHGLKTSLKSGPLIEKPRIITYLC